jgi:hypothetical protein
MKDQKEIDLDFLKLAIAHEETMVQLYELFRIHVPKSAKLWDALISEEKLHASRFKLLNDEVTAGRAHLGPERPGLGGIKASIDSIKGKIAMWRRDGVSKTDAYEYAMLLEGGMVEDRLFASCEEDSPLAQSILYEMQSGTNNHFHRIRKEYEENDMSVGFFKHVKAKFKSLFDNE